MASQEKSAPSHSNPIIRVFFLGFFSTLPFQFALSPLPGIDLHLSRVFSLMLGLLWVIFSLFNRSLRIPIFFAFPTFLFLLAIFSLFGAEHVDWGARKIAFIISFAPILIVASDLFYRGNTRFVITFFKCLTAGAVASGLIGIIQSISPAFIGLDPSLAIWTRLVLPFFSGIASSETISEYSSMVANVGGINVFRASALFPDPHIASFFWGMSLPLAILLAFRSFGSFRWIFGIGATVILLADILTFSRGGLLALCVTGVFALWRNRSLLSDKLPLVTYTSILIGVLAFGTPNPVSNRLFSIFDSSDHSVSGRLAIWRETVEVIKDHPLIGVGIGNYSNTIKPSADYREPRYAHNLFLDIASETGIASAILVMLGIVISCAIAIRRKGYIVSVGFSLVIFLVHGLFESPIYSVHILPLLLVLIAVPLQFNRNTNEHR